MQTELQEIARYRIEDSIRAAERRALRRELRNRVQRPGPRDHLATALHRLADRLQPRPVSCASD